MLLPFQVFKTSICSQRRGHCDYKGIPPFDCCALYNKKNDIFENLGFQDICLRIET